MLGNQTVDLRLVPLDLARGLWPQEQRRLAHFLRIMIRREEIAVQVVVAERVSGPLVLVPGDRHGGGRGVVVGAQPAVGLHGRFHGEDLGHDAGLLVAARRRQDKVGRCRRGRRHRRHEVVRLGGEEIGRARATPAKPNNGTDPIQTHQPDKKTKRNTEQNREKQGRDGEKQPKQPAVFEFTRHPPRAADPVPVRDQLGVKRIAPPRLHRHESRFPCFFPAFA